MPHINFDRIKARKRDVTFTLNEKTYSAKPFTSSLESQLRDLEAQFEDDDDATISDMCVAKLAFLTDCPEEELCELNPPELVDLTSRIIDLMLAPQRGRSRQKKR